MTRFVIVNGPRARMALVTDRWPKASDRIVDADDDEIEYVVVSDTIFVKEQPLAMIRGTAFQHLDGGRMILFAHPQFKPTLLDLDKNTLSECEFRTDQ